MSSPLQLSQLNTEYSPKFSVCLSKHCLLFFNKHTDRSACAHPSCLSLSVQSYIVHHQCSCQYKATLSKRGSPLCTMVQGLEITKKKKKNRLSCGGAQLICFGGAWCSLYLVVHWGAVYCCCGAQYRSSETKRNRRTDTTKRAISLLCGG